MEIRMTQLWLVVCHVVYITCQDNNKKDAKYIIIGAGIAGLSAAKQLSSHGEEDFIILEADSRIGGRVKSVQFGGKTVEVGAQWINSYSTEIGKLAQRADLETHKSDYDDYIVLNSEGVDITDDSYDRYEVFVVALEYLHNLSKELSNNKYKPDVSQRAALSLGGWRPRDMLDYAIEYYDHEFVYGHKSETASTRYADIPSFDDTYTEEVVIDQKGGMEKIITLLHDDALAGNTDRLKLYSKVKTIKYNDDGVTITTDDSHVYTCDYVILTVSLGVLQNEAITFEPPLPNWKTYSIQGSTFVTDIPIYLKFPSTTLSFWNDYEYFLYVGKRRGYYTLWQNFHYLIPGSGILQIQLADEEAKRVSKYATESEIIAEIQTVMAEMYQRTIPEPEILIPRWANDPLQYGSYSDRLPSFSDESVAALNAPVGRIYFAGEAYHTHFGYMEGAYNSAVEVVDKLLACKRDSAKCEMYTPPYDSTGCTYNSASNYADDAQLDDGSCTFNKDAISTSNTYPVIASTLGICLMILLSHSVLIDI